MKLPSGEKVSPVITVRCCLKKGRKHEKGEENKQTKPQKTVATCRAQESKIIRGRQRTPPHSCLQLPRTINTPTFWKMEQQVQHSSCPCMGHAPSPFGASSATHAEAPKGSLFSCSLGQALPYCWPTAHREVTKKALVAFAGWTFTTRASAQQAISA